MQGNIDISKHPYGLNGSVILTGSMQVAGEFFWFHPISSSIATVKFSDNNGPLTSISFPNGVEVYGFITEVTQSSGLSIVYYGAENEPRFTSFNIPSLTPTPSITSTPSITPSVTTTPSVTPTVTSTPSITSTPSVTPTVTRTPSVTPTRTPSLTPSISVTPSLTPSPSI